MVWECWGHDLRQSNDKETHLDELDSGSKHLSAMLLAASDVP
jgi:hypothetical protein